MFTVNNKDTRTTSPQNVQTHLKNSSAVAEQFHRNLKNSFQDNKEYFLPLEIGKHFIYIFCITSQWSLKDTGQLQSRVRKNQEKSFYKI